MTRKEFELWATAHGWTKDQWGHYHKGDRRFKLSKTAVRLEAKAGSAGWVRLRSGYFSRLRITDTVKLAGLTY
jgi:hypothetical protein